ncbi:MAG: hypothetical protein KGQ38_07550, partial [Actinomycetales bacterium]|nr:hypothetical protein [Actinomycetales bacterium]
MTSTLISGNQVYAPGIPDAEAILIDNGQIAWIGDRSTAKTFASEVSQSFDLGDVFIAPGFVDAHVHLSATGALLSGASVSMANSWRELAEQVNESLLTQEVIDQFKFFFGWDDTNWS